MKKANYMIVCFAVMVLSAYAASGQQMAADSTTPIDQDSTVTKRVIKGVVLDSIGPLIGATIVINNKERRTLAGTAANMEGEFELTLPVKGRKLSEHKYLEASYVDYKPYLMALDTLKTDSLHIILELMHTDTIIHSPYGRTSTIGINYGPITMPNVCESDN